MYYKLLYYIQRVEDFDGAKTFEYAYIYCESTNLN